MSYSEHFLSTSNWFTDAAHCLKLITPGMNPTAYCSLPINKKTVLIQADSHFRDQSPAFLLQKNLNFTWRQATMAQSKAYCQVKSKSSSVRTCKKSFNPKRSFNESFEHIATHWYAFQAILRPPSKPKTNCATAMKCTVAARITKMWKISAQVIDSGSGKHLRYKPLYRQCWGVWSDARL